MDFAFIPLWGEESYVIEKLKPKVTFPMHDLGREHKYKELEKTVAKDNLPTTAVAAENKGDRFSTETVGSSIDILNSRVP